MSGDAVSQWTPFVRISEKDSVVLEEIGIKLEATLTVTNKILSVAHSEFPKIEDTFASAGDAIQNMVTQLVEANCTFCKVKLQLQARTEAVNNLVDMLTTDIDNLHVLHRNIRKDNFKTGDYLELFMDLASCMHCHLAKTHNADGKDLMDFCEFMRRSMDIVTKLDPSTHRDAKDWSGIFKELLTTMHSQTNAKSTQHGAERDLVGKVKEALDQIPRPICPHVGPSNANRNGNASYTHAKHHWHSMEAMVYQYDKYSSPQNCFNVCHF